VFREKLKRLSTLFRLRKEVQTLSVDYGNRKEGLFVNLKGRVRISRRGSGTSGRGKPFGVCFFERKRAER